MIVRNTGMDLIDFLGYSFIQRGLIAGSFIALLCASLGVLLVLRRLSLIGDGLAHVTFGSVALGLFLRVSPLYVSIPVVMASALGILKLTEKARVYGDAAIGMVSAIGIAAGILIANLAGGFNIDLFSYLFGNILAISTADVFVSIALALVVLGVIILFYHELFSVSFDEEFAETTGIDTEKINVMLVLLTAVTVVLAMKVVGIMLTSALLIIPAITAFQIARGFKNSMIVASIVAMLSVVAGISLSFFLNLPTGSTIVVMNFAFFLITLIWNKLVSRLFKKVT
jgi:zinc transport system permease protein